MAVPPIPKHDPVKLAIAKYALAQLVTITKAHGYLFDVGPRRAYMEDLVREIAETPAVFMVMRTENVSGLGRDGGDLSGRVGCDLLVNVGFVDTDYGEQNAEKQILWQSTIQYAMGYQHQISGFYKMPIPPSDTGEACSIITMFTETGNAVNVTERLTGKIHGQVDYVIRYQRQRLHPWYI
jgi:hypothetical protein